MLKITLCFLFASLALLQSYFAFDRQRNAIPYSDVNENVTLSVVSKSTASDYFSAFEVVTSTEKGSFKAILECEYKSDLKVGDIVEGEVKIQPVENSYENAYYYHADGIFAVLRSDKDNWSEIGHHIPRLTVFFHSLNKKLSFWIEDSVGGQAADLTSAMFLGNRHTLDQEIQRDFSRIGLAHILSLSGMHLSVIMLLMDELLKKLSVKKQWRCVGVLIFSLFYLALTGFALSTVRAFIMMTFVCAAFLLSRENDPVTSLFFALFLIFVIFPTAVLDVGIWMSFLAVLGIFTVEYFQNVLTDKLYRSRLNKRIIKALISIFALILISVSANVFVSLPLWLAFGEISLLAVPANLILSPMSSVLLFLTPLLLVLHFLPLFSAVIPYVAAGIRLLCNVIIHMASRLSHLENITISLNYRFVPFILIPASILLLVFLIVPLRRKYWLAVVPLASAVLFSGMLILHNYRYRNVVTVDYLSYGESEMLVATENSKAVICDLSTGSHSYLFDAIELCQSRYNTEVDALVLTHYHTLHISTFSKNAARFMIRHLYLPYPETEDEYHIMKSLIATAEKKKVKVTVYQRGSDFLPTQVIMLNISPGIYLNRSTHPTFSVSLSAYDQNVVYIAESAHEEEVLRNHVREQVGDADFIILGTHGPVTKTNFTYASDSLSPYFIISDKVVFSHFKKPQEDAQLLLNVKQVTLALSKAEE